MIILLFLVALAFPAYAELPANWTQIVPSATVKLRDPQDLSLSPGGVLYVADTGHHRVIAVDTSGNLVAETGGFGSGHGQFQWPRQVVAAWGSSVWVLDFGNRRIEKFTRSFEYQGTLEITVPSDATRHQPGAMALAPQGDLYVFDRDGSRVVRYDPLFTVQAELGSGSGAQFVSNIVDMAFVSGRGVFWWERGGRELMQTDALLNPATPIVIGVPPDHLCLTASDTCLVYGSLFGLLERCRLDAPPDTLISAAVFHAAGLKSLQAVTVSPDHEYFLLDGAAGAIYRVSGARE